MKGFGSCLRLVFGVVEGVAAQRRPIGIEEVCLRRHEGGAACPGTSPAAAFADLDGLTLLRRGR